MQLKNKTIIITGSSRGIGEAMALRFAKEGANLVVAAKTTEPHPKLPGTIYTVAKEIEKLGGQALPIPLDIRFEDQIAHVVQKTIETFGQIDILINNASALFPMPTLQTPAKKYDLIMDCNVRGTFLCSQSCLPHLMKSSNPHILNMSPPLNLKSKWFKDHLAYSLSKYGMSLCTLGMSAEFSDAHVAVNSLWPKTLIATSAVAAFFPDLLSHCRRPEITAEAAYKIITKDSKTFSGNFLIDEDVLREEGMTEFSHYAMSLSDEPQTDLFVE